jgi:uncharacterized protein
MDFTHWQSIFQQFLMREAGADAAHDLSHIRRVVHNATHFAAEEGATLAVVLPAAWLHDCVAVPKDSPDRPRASRLAAERATEFLRQVHYPAAYLSDIQHAIAAHSFSAKIPPQTIEAKVVQDADRIDALGAIGLARCFIVGGQLNRPIYDEADPFCRDRTADDAVSSLDHFYTKLFKLLETMQTDAGRQEAQRRTDFLKLYLAQLAQELPMVDEAPGI